MNKDTYAVIGLGKFGAIVALELIDQGKTVMIADADERALKALQDQANFAYILDSTDIVALKEAGFSNADIVILSIGENLEASILTIASLVELGVKTIVAKANSPVHGKILSKLGATKVIYPERESAKRLARDFLRHPEFDVVDITANTLRSVQIKVTDKIAGKSLKDIAQNLKVIGYKKADEEWDLDPDAQSICAFMGDSVMLFGTVKELKKYNY